MRIGVDTGGTFTDFAWLQPGPGGAFARQVLKLPSTPDDPARAVIEGVEQILAASAPRPRRIEIVHGTTVATNALLARQGARVVLLTTAGFEDVLAIGRQERPKLYDLYPSLPPPLVPRDRRLGVRERLGVDGEIVKELTAAEIRRCVRAVLRLKPEAVAVCLLHSCSAPAHEQQLGASLAEALRADVPVFLSHRVDPQPREYERTSTTVLHAYLCTAVSGYLRRLEAGLPRGCRLSLLTSSGGVATVAQACERPADLVLSGPAGGVIGAAAVARQAGIQRFIGLDMGGTSTDVCLGWDSATEAEGWGAGVSETSEGTVSGLPLRVPRLAVHTIGAGGGSLARAGSGGTLLVGPQSAGADPGPAAYGKGSGVTVTDACILLRRLPTKQLLGGQTRLYPALAREHLSVLAQSLGLTTQRCAEGIVLLAEQAMAQAVRQVSQQQGYDPRLCVLIPFGGAGALHACGIAEQLGIRRILIPAQAGCLSAVGALISRPRRDAGEAVMRELGKWPAADRTARFRALRLRLAAQMPRPLDWRYRLHCRYQGQSFELAVELHNPAASGAQIAALFHAAHQQAYGYHRAEQSIEVVWAQVTALGAAATALGTEATALGAQAKEPGTAPGPAANAHRSGAGPAVIAQQTTTVYVATGWSYYEDEQGNMHLL